jgi:MFS family permease
MLGVLSNRIYAKLFAAQIVALLGTGLLTIALGLVAFELAGDAAGVVLGLALTLKMIAYVGFSPIANALFARWDRKSVLIGADLIRAAIALMLPFVDEIWQIYGLIFLLQAASATFTPAFQAIIPDILKDESDYTRALSLSRLAYDIENIVSPALAGLLLSFMSFHWLFVGTAFGFSGSILLIAITQIPGPEKPVTRDFLDRLTRGSRIYLATPRLRGLLALNFAATTGGAMVIVNSVVIVRSEFAGSASDVALAMGAFGLGSMISALSLPSLLGTLKDRVVMFFGALFLTIITTGFAILVSAIGWSSWAMLLGTWMLIGMAYSAILTPSGRLLRRSSHSADRPALFAAQFALSHACWLVTYPLAGILGNAIGLAPAMIVLGVLAALSTLLAFRLWPKAEGQGLAHSHADLPKDHPHLADGNGKTHQHAFVIDDEHRAWPTNG